MSPSFERLILTGGACLCSRRPFWKQPSFSKGVFFFAEVVFFSSCRLPLPNRQRPLLQNRASPLRNPASSPSSPKPAFLPRTWNRAPFPQGKPLQDHLPRN